MSKYESKLENFISNNSELIGEYESLDCAIPVEYCYEEIIENYIKLSKIDKSIDFNRC